MADLENASTLEGVGRALRNPLKLNQATRLAIDAFAQRYAAARDLEYAPDGETPPATWFLETVVPAKSHSFMQGRDRRWCRSGGCSSRSGRGRPGAAA